MRNLKYVAFLMSIGLLGFSPTVVHADDTNVAIVQEDTGQIVEPSEDTGQVAEPPEDTSIDSGVATGSAIEVSVPSNITYEKKEIQLDSVPSDLRVDLPTAVTLEVLNDNQYGYTDKIKISCDSDNEYRVELSIKDTNITYVSSDGSTVSGVATIGDSVSYSWSYEDVTSGMEIPLSVVVDKPEYIGSYTTTLNFSIDIYQMQEIEVKTEENASDTKDIEKIEDTKVDEIKENTEVEVEEDTQVSDESEVQPPTSEDNIVVTNDPPIAGVAFENTDTLFISKDITSINADAFDNLDLLKVINFEGTEEEWSKIFTGSLNAGVVLNFSSSITNDFQEIPTESTLSDVEDSQSDEDNLSQDLAIEDNQSTAEVEPVEDNLSGDSSEIIENADSMDADTESAETVSDSIDE